MTMSGSLVASLGLITRSNPGIHPWRGSMLIVVALLYVSITADNLASLMLSCKICSILIALSARYAFDGLGEASRHGVECVWAGLGLWYSN
jgi:hypothetical protein